MKRPRRHFLLASAGLSAAIAGGAICRRWLQPSAATTSNGTAAESIYETTWIGDGRFTVKRNSLALGSRVSIVAVHDDAEAAVAAIDAAFDELERIESVMSVYRPDSQLSQLNRQGRLKDADPSLVEVLRYAEMVSRRSAGAFDVTVQPMWELYAATQKQGRLPTEAEIASVRRLVDWRRVRIDDDRITLSGEGTTVTLNGIAQGFAADRAMARLRNSGIEHALIDTGELAPLGQNARQESWSAGIQHPRDTESLAAVTPLDDRCLATSGDYATTFSADRRFNHLFDPSTGRSPQGLASVSILAPTAMQADALSTACFVLGPQGALELVESLPGVDALLIPTSGRVQRTAGFRLSGGEAA
jgi:FAD:protein FMN transferase